MVSATTRLLVLLSLAGTLLLTSCDVLDIVGLGSGRSSLRPNEPAGFVPWFEHDWQTWPNARSERMLASGTGMILSSHYERDAAEDFVLVDDPDAPHGKGKSLRHRQREGQKSRTTSGIFNLFSPKHGAGTSIAYDDQRQLRSVYRSHWVYFEPDPVTHDWQFGGYHMRTFWWNRHYGLGHGNVSLRSPPYGEIHSLQRSKYWRGVGAWHSTPSTVYWHDSEPLALGEWHHVEVLWETVGEFDVENGIDSRVRTWINGEQVADHSFNHYIQRPFANDHFAMVWSGFGPSERVQDDFIRFGDIYISGIPYQD